MGTRGRGRRYPKELQDRRGAINSFLNAQSWVGAKQVVEREPDLFDERALDLLDELRRAAQDRGNNALAGAYEQVSEVIARCWAVGVDAAFDELRRVRKRRVPKEKVMTRDGGPTTPALTAYLEAGGTDAMDVLEQHPEIISESSIHRIDDYIQHFRRQGDRVSVRTLQMRRDILRQLLDAGG